MKAVRPLLLTLFILSFAAQVKGWERPQWWFDMHEGKWIRDDWWLAYTLSSAYFGPNALPVPEWKTGKIPEHSAIEASADFFAGGGDWTQSLSLRFEYVPLPGRISIEAWGVLYEHYTITRATRDLRCSMLYIPDGEETGSSNTWIGDFYISTNIAILREAERRPDLMLRLVLKTASSSDLRYSRFFDTPGYMFDFTCGKTWQGPKVAFRLSGDVGFLCYQRNERLQDDALMLSLNTSFIWERLTWENGTGGYWGWANNGDHPWVIRSRLSAEALKGKLFLQYQYGIEDCAPHRLQLGYCYTFKTF